MSANVEGEAPARTARRLLAAAGHGVLASTLAPDDDAAGASPQPYATLVQGAPQADGAVLLLISDLARHTRNLAANPRCGLLIDGTAEGPDRLAGARLALIGAAAPATDQRVAKRAFLERHPQARGYAGFGDFRCWRFVPDCGDLVAGFGHIERIPAAALAAGNPSPAMPRTQPDQG